MEFAYFIILVLVIIISYRIYLSYWNKKNIEVIKSKVAELEPKAQIIMKELRGELGGIEEIINSDKINQSQLFTLENIGWYEYRSVKKNPELKFIQNGSLTLSFNQLKFGSDYESRIIQFDKIEDISMKIDYRIDLNIAYNYLLIKRDKGKNVLFSVDLFDDLKLRQVVKIKYLWIIYNEHKNQNSGVNSRDFDKNNRHISQKVKDLVWNRDNGKCVECGSQEKLEFDHIIPFSKGGANTYRNVQILCEQCNRKKSAKIG